MSQPNVEQILRKVQSLSDEDRTLFDRRLAELDEAQWRAEAEVAREKARADGVDQAHIDRTIERLR